MLIISKYFTVQKSQLNRLKTNKIDEKHIF